MATLFEPVPTIAPQTNAAPSMGIRADADAFGAGIGRAVSGLGESIQGAAKTGMDALIAEQHLRNEIHASEANTWLADKITERYGEYSKLEGKSSLDALPQFKKDIDQLYTDHLSTAPSLQERAMLARNGKQLTARYYGWAEQRAAGQFRTWQDKTSVDRAASYGNVAGLAAANSDDQGMAVALNTSDDEVRKLYEGRGWPKQEIEQEVAKNRGRNLKQIIETQSVEDPMGAVARFKQMAPQMDAATRLSTSNHLRPIVTKLRGREIADEELGRTPEGGPKLTGTLDARADSAANEAGIDPRVLKAIVRLESGGDPNAQKGSYKGLGQLSDEKFAQHGGQGNIFEPGENLRVTARHLAAESKAFEAKYGHMPSATELYLVHQQGEGGFAAHMANPDAPAWTNMASTAEGRRKGDGWAQLAIWGNVPDSEKARFGSVDNISSRQFMDLWDRKVGGQLGTALPDKIVAFERINERTKHNPMLQDAATTYANRIYSVYQKDTTQAKAAFKSRWNDTAQEALRTGSVTAPLTRDDFLSNLGPVDGDRGYREYQAQLQFGTDVQLSGNMSPQERYELRRKYEPKPGQEGYAEQAKRYDEIVKAGQQADGESGVNSSSQKADAGLFAMSRLPGVREAHSKMAAALTNKDISEGQRRAAVDNFVGVTLAEQERIGVATDKRAILPKEYIEQIKKDIMRPAQAGGAASVADNIEAQTKIWGDNWPLVYRQIQGDVAPIVRVIGSGVQPTAARILTELAPLQLPDILKDENTEKSSQIKKDVLNAFKPFAASMAGSEDRLAIFNDFRGQAEKLAAYYVVNGKTSSEAADQAFKDLLGHKYTFQDNYRIPKSITQTAGEISMGAQTAKSMLGKPIPGAPAGRFAGQIEPGNIDLDKRPVVKNADGSISTVRSMSANVDGREVVLPTVSDDGRTLSADEAIEQFRKTGKHLGKFDTPDNATAYARAVHDQQQRRHTSPLELGPARDTFGGLRPEYLAEAPAKAYQRDGVWVTAPGDVGLMLVYKDEAVRTKEGKPLILSWQQLSDYAKPAQQRRDTQFERHFRAGAFN